MFTSMSIVSCAELRRLSCMRVAMVLRMPLTGMRCPPAGAGGMDFAAPGAGAADGFAAARSTSSFVMRPPGPVPVTRARSTPSSAARRFASGDAGPAAAAGADVAAGAAAAARTSASTMRPPGPVPRTEAISTFISPASRRAAGDDRSLPPDAMGAGVLATAACSGATAATATGAAGADADGPVEGIASPGA